MSKGFGQCFEFGGDTGSGAGDLGVLAHAVGGCFGAVSGAEGVHHPDIAKRGHFLRKLFVGFFFAFVATAVFQHDDFARLDFKATIDPVLDEANFFAEQFRTCVWQPVRESHRA